ncbi:hypothetical protein PINS_up009501 [Pythium insidiosum]|nr:hypothetical protein PINS_up009501 [Pythium insidiosum]
MIAVKWRLDHTVVEPNALHMVEVAHDWAVDTLLDLQTPLQVPNVSASMGVRPDRLRRDLLAAITSSLEASNPPTLRPLDARDVLESAAELLDRDEWIALLVATMAGASNEAPALGAKARHRVLQREESTGRWLLDALPWTSRVCVWASDPSIWRGQVKRQPQSCAG